jgi:hypothetical protein
MGDFNVHIGSYPSTILNTETSFTLSQSGPADADDCAGLELARRSIDTNSADTDFVDQMDIAGMVILNGLRDVGDGPEAETTHAESSVIDYIMVDAEHWQMMDSVTVMEDAAWEVTSDHQLITSVIRYEPLKDPDSAAASLVPITDTVSHLISDTRYSVQTRGNTHHFDDFEAACTKELGQFIAELDAEDVERDIDAIDIEDVWARFLTKLRSIAANTLGTKKLKQRIIRGNRDVFRGGDKLLTQWKRQRWKIRRERTSVDPSDHRRLEQIDAEHRRLTVNINNHLRSGIREAENRQLQRISQLGHAQMREHWKQLKAVGNIKPAPMLTPSSAVDGAGVEHSDPAGVRSVWFDCWGKLAEHHPDNPRFDRNHHDEVERKMCEDDQIESETESLTPAQIAAAASLNQPITVAEVQQSINRLGNSKSPGADGVVSELLKNGGEMMTAVLHRICDIAWQQSEVPMDWLRGVVVPLYKDGDRRAPLNYRPITLLSIAGKVYTGVLQSRLMKWSEANNIIEPEQGGFRPGRGCPEQLFTLTELIKLKRLRKQHTFACFIDIRKAYDTVWHAGMQRKLREYGISGPMYRALCSLYSGCESTVRLGGQLGYTDFFPIETGVRQGCILSPWLYSLFINDLTRLLKKQTGFGASIDAFGEHRLCVLLYADDIVLLSDDENGLEHLMDTVHAYADEWRFEVNHSKCGLMRFNKDGGSQLPISELTIGSTVIPWVRSYKYLGVELHNGVPFRMFRKRMLASATRAGHQVAGMGMYSGKLSVPLGVQVYKALVRPLLEYAAEVTSLSPWPDAERLQIAMGKRILQCPTRTCNVGVRGELGWHLLESRFQQLRVSFWGKLQCISPFPPR